MTPITKFVSLAAVASLANSAYSAVLVQHYLFEGDGSDSAGSSDGTVGSGVSFGTGIQGQAMVVGVSGAAPVNVIDAPAFDPGTGDFSIAFWVRRDQNDTVNADGIFDALAGTGVGYQANFRAGADLDQMGFRIDGSDGNFSLIVDPNATSDTDWHHFALTIDRTANEGILYRDGVEAISAPLAFGGSVTPTQNLQIGGINNSAILGLDGSLDDLRFYTGVLTPSEVQALVVPEPGTSVFLGLLGIAAGLRRRR
ncbi:MAG: PEP-CTERM sorting domain-containing protein [Akkermansiaceae bacterium]|jgi:hypothetical protein